jgi:hypothetical protein
MTLSLRLKQSAIIIALSLVIVLILLVDGVSSSQLCTTNCESIGGHVKVKRTYIRNDDVKSDTFVIPTVLSNYQVWSECYDYSGSSTSVRISVEMHNGGIKHKRYTCSALDCNTCTEDYVHTVAASSAFVANTAIPNGIALHSYKYL